VTIKHTAVCAIRLSHIPFCYPSSIVTNNIQQYAKNKHCGDDYHASCTLQFLVP